MEKICCDSTTSSILTNTSRAGGSLNSMTQGLARLRRFFLFLLLSFSFGGFLFYAGVVVPIGSSVLGTTTQGFVTRLVTNALNAAVAVTLVFMIWEVFAGKHRRSASCNRWLSLWVAVISVCWLVLVGLHPLLDSLLDTEEFAVKQHSRFYGLHRVYLWVSTIEWLGSLPFLWILVNSPAGESDVEK